MNQFERMKSTCGPKVSTFIGALLVEYSLLDEFWGDVEAFSSVPPRPIAVIDAVTLLNFFDDFGWSRED